jgi:hypothetical protein
MQLSIISKIKGVNNISNKNNSLIELKTPALSHPVSIAKLNKTFLDMQVLISE